MRIKIVSLILCLAAFTSCSKSSIEEIETENTVEEATPAQISAIESELHDLINDHRQNIGLKSLSFSADAYTYAIEHTDYMIGMGEISHDNFSERASKVAAATNALSVAENVAKSYANANAALQGWLNSSAHKNTIEGDYTNTTISIKADTNGDLYFTQIFFKK
ncbi:MAG: CAP domain-containing protein [Flavobacteriaceae bacterium]|nr:CAP domain-containing protein [Flavobacteriaceae bacterium]